MYTSQHELFGMKVWYTVFKWPVVCCGGESRQFPWQRHHVSEHIHFGCTKGIEFYTPGLGVQSLLLPLSRRFSFWSHLFLSVCLSAGYNIHSQNIMPRLMEQWILTQNFLINFWCFLTLRDRVFSLFSHELLYSIKTILAHLSRDCLSQCVFCFRSRSRLNIPKHFLLLK